MIKKHLKEKSGNVEIEILIVGVLQLGSPLEGTKDFIVRCHNKFSNKNQTSKEGEQIEKIQGVVLGSNLGLHEMEIIIVDAKITCDLNMKANR